MAAPPTIDTIFDGIVPKPQGGEWVVSEGRIYDMAFDDRGPLDVGYVRDGSAFVFRQYVYPPISRSLRSASLFDLIEMGPVKHYDRH